MKRLLPVLTLILMLSASACYKAGSGYGPNISTPKLVGKWRIAASYVSIGGPGIWIPVPATTNYDYVQFKDNQLVLGTVFPDYVTYALKDSITITMTKADKTTYEDFRYLIKGDSLFMSPYRPSFCIEGCGTKFVYVGN